MVNRYKPNARNNIAATSLPNGKSYYQNRVEHYTTIDITAAEVHKIGLKEVERIRTEMNDIIKSVRFDGDFAAFINFFYAMMNSFTQKHLLNY